MPPKKSAQSQQIKRIHWVFRKSAEENDHDAEAEQLFATLVDCCDAFAFQLESAPTTGYLHFQGYFALTNKNRFCWIQNNICKFEFLQEMGKNSSPQKAWSYATKQDTRILGPWEYGTVPELGKSKDTTYQEALAAPTVREGLQIVKTNKPRDYCLYGSAIIRNLEANLSKPFKHQYELKDFNREPLIFKKTSHVYGPSNTGKTSFVTAHFKNPLVVSHIDTLKKLSADNDAIIFDDMSFAHWPPESVIHLVDRQFDRDINVRYSTVHIPANTTKVFTHNSRDIFYKPEVNPDQIAAIDRRVEYFHVPTKLFAVQAIIPEEFAEHSIQEED